MPFHQFGLPSSLVQNVLALGYEAPTPIQIQAIPAVRSGRDLVATAQTGTGKTAAFLLPVLDQLLARPRGSAGALVLTPTRELAQQIDGVCRGLAAGTGLRGVLVVGGAPAHPQIRGVRAGADLVIATPGRLLAHLRDGAFALSGLKTLILDEADQMFDMGFFPDLKRILSFLPPRRQTLLFSATMPSEVANLSRSLLRDPLTVTIGTQGAAARTVTQNVYLVPAHRKTALLCKLLEQFEMPSVLVFTRTRRGAKRLAKSLAAASYGVDELHADRTPAQRLRTMQGFRERAFPILVATNIAARGLDVRHVTHVINYDLPEVPEDYVHRIGRTGRAGDEGDALMLVSPEEAGLLARIEKQLGRKLPRRHLEEFDYTVRPEMVAGRGPANRAQMPRPRKSTRGQGRR